MLSPSNEYLLATTPERPHRVWWVYDDDKARVFKALCWAIANEPRAWYVPDLGGVAMVDQALFDTHVEAVRAAKEDLWVRIEWCRARLLEIDQCES